MRELARVMPAGSWLQTADASVAGEPDARREPTAATAAAPPGPRPTSGLHAQPADVARMMVRLRQMHRVTDVELNESAPRRRRPTREVTVGQLRHATTSSTSP